MNKKQIRSIALVIVMVLSVFSVVGTASAASSTEISLEPSNQTVNEGDSTTYDVVIENASGGVGSYEFDISTDNVSAATITDVTLEGNPPSQFTDINFAPDNSSVEVTAAAADTANSGQVTVMTVTVSGVEGGDSGESQTADLNLDVINDPGDENGNTYTVTGVNDATVTVSGSGGDSLFAANQILSDDLEVTISDADFDQESAVVITRATSNEVVGVNENLASADFNGAGDDVQVELTGNLDTTLSTDDYSAYVIDQTATIPNVGDTYEDGDAGADQINAVQGVTVFHTAYSVVGVEGPVSTFNGATIDVTANITNLGVADNTENINLIDSNGNTVATRSIDGINGEFEEFTFENIDTATLPNADPNAVNTDSLTVSTNAAENDAGTAATALASFTVGTDQEGEVFVDVRNADAEFSEVEGATVTISDSDGTQIAQAETPASGTVSFDGLAVSGDSGAPERYTVQASAPDLELDSDSTVAALFVDGNDRQRETTVTLNLRSNLDAQYVDVVNFNDDTNTVVDEDAALFANGEFENTDQFAVVTQNQQNDALSTSLDVTVEFTGQDPDGTDLTDPSDTAFNDAFGEGPGSYADDDDAVRTLTLTVSGSSESIPVDEIGNAAQIQNASGDAPIGNVSVATFNVTSALANETTLNDPVIIESFTAEATNSSGNVLGTDSGIDASRNGNNVTYFLQGDTKISGQVQTLANGETVYPNATVYVAYSGGPQDLSTIESFQNDQGVSFLTAEPNENGDYVIDGLVEEAIDGDESLEANLYVVSEGFNTFNMTNEPAPLSGTFAAEYVAPINEADVDRTGNTFQFTFAHVLDEAALAYDLDVTAEDTTLDEQVKEARVAAGENSTIEVSVQQGDLGATPDSVAPNQQIEIELTDDNIPGELVGADNDGIVTTETNSNGVAEVIFAADGTQSVETAANLSSNVTASTVNVNGDEFNTTADDPRSFNNEANQSTLTVFATGQIAGDVVDANNTLIPSASPEFDVEVELLRFNETSDRFDILVDNTTTVPNGEFSFAEVPTGQDYRAVATVTRTANNSTETGTSRTINNLQPVTENADIVVPEINVEENQNESVSDPEDPVATVTFDDKTVQNGTEEITVDSANFTLADGSAGDYVVVVHVVNATEFDGGVDNSISAPVGASGDLTGAEESITVDLNSSAAFEGGDARDSLTENVTLRAMLHTTDNDSAFGTRLGSAIDGLEPGDETDDANITVQDEPASDPVERFDTNGEPGIQDDEVLNAISAFNEGEEGVEAGDVLDVISAFNEA